MPATHNFYSLLEKVFRCCALFLSRAFIYFAYSRLLSCFWSGKSEHRLISQHLFVSAHLRTSNSGAAAKGMVVFYACLWLGGWLWSYAKDCRFAPDMHAIVRARTFKAWTDLLSGKPNSSVFLKTKNSALEEGSLSFIVHLLFGRRNQEVPKHDGSFLWKMTAQGSLNIDPGWGWDKGLKRSAPNSFDWTRGAPRENDVEPWNTGEPPRPLLPSKSGGPWSFPNSDRNVPQLIWYVSPFK